LFIFPINAYTTHPCAAPDAVRRGSDYALSSSISYSHPGTTHGQIAARTDTWSSETTSCRHRYRSSAGNPGLRHAGRPDSDRRTRVAGARF